MHINYKNLKTNIHHLVLELLLFTLLKQCYIPVIHNKTNRLQPHINNRPSRTSSMHQEKWTWILCYQNTGELFCRKFQCKTAKKFMKFGEFRHFLPTHLEQTNCASRYCARLMKLSAAKSRPTQWIKHHAAICYVMYVIKYVFVN